MDYLDRFLVLSHVFAGITALFVAPLAMLTVKGGLWHRRWGKVYFYGMLWIFCSTLALSFFRFNFFLFIVNIFSFYQALSGYRVLYRKRPTVPGEQPNWIDRLAAGVMGFAGVAFVAWGAAGLLGVNLPALLLGFSITPFYVIGLVVGALIARAGISDWFGLGTKPTDPRWWWYEHMARFLGAYAATVTAFLVQNATRFVPAGFEWMVWVLPGVLIGAGATRWVRMYRAKFAAPVAKAA